MRVPPLSDVALLPTWSRVFGKRPTGAITEPAARQREPGSNARALVVHEREHLEPLEILLASFFACHD